MCQPRSNLPRPGWLWAADNGCFSDKWDEGRWLAWLTKDHPRSGCLFAVVPDVVADAVGTQERFEKYADQVRELRYPVAYAAQNGLELLSVPWDELDCLFIGGDDGWKLSETVRRLAAEARERGKWVHLGRVNSNKRYAAWAADADSCDGTFIAYGPTVNTPKMVRWLDDYERAPQLSLPPHAE